MFDSTGQTVADNTTTTLSADSELFDNDAMHSTVTNTSRITVQTAGRYDFTCRVNFQADITDGRRVIQMRYNGTTTTTLLSVRAVVDGNSQTISGSMKAIMAASDYMEVRVLHTAGNNLTVTLQEFTALFITR